MSIKNLSVFFPVFNEEGNVENTVKNALRVLEKLKLEDFEVIIINDGSIDQTGKVADSLAKKNSKVRTIHHRKNLGYGEALKSGFYGAKFDTIVYTDGDGQFDFSEVSKFLEKIEDHDLLIGYRIKRQDPFFRILFKKGWKLSLLAFFRLTLKDVDCGFKMVKKSVLEKIPHLESSRGAMINAELAIKAKKAGFKIGQVGVSHFPRRSGNPTGANLNVIIKSYLDLVKLWWELKTEKVIFILILAVLILAAFLRFYKLDQYMIFLGDQGRDAIIVKNMIDEQHFPAIGPSTSVGNIYLGPLYYYMMFVPMVSTNFNPVSASVMVALIGVATVFLIYYLGKVWFGKGAGLLAAYLYAISPVNINYSNFSWNPNPAPFFALLSILGFYLSKKLSNYRWMVLSGAAAAFAIQMHYLALILLPILLTLWFNAFFKRLKGKHFWQGTILAVLVFALLMSPLVFFDLRHNFLNYRAMTAFFLQSNTNVNLNLFGILERIPQIYSYDLIGRYVVGENKLLTILVSVVLLIPLLKTGYLIYKKREFSWGLWVLNNWLLIGILGLGLYSHTIYDHYLGFLNPAPFLLLGSLVTIKFSDKLTNLRNILLILIIIVLTWVNLVKNPLLNPPNNQLKRTQDVAKFIIGEAGDKDFNFALLSENNYDSAYQFYLEIYGAESKKVPFDITDQLFVVCEDPQCQPIYSPKYEIAAFGWTLVEKEWEVEGIKLYKLIHNPKEPKI